MRDSESERVTYLCPQASRSPTDALVGWAERRIRHRALVRNRITDVIGAEIKAGDAIAGFGELFGRGVNGGGSWGWVW